HHFAVHLVALGALHHGDDDEAAVGHAGPRALAVGHAVDGDALLRILGGEPDERLDLGALEQPAGVGQLAVGRAAAAVRAGAVAVRVRAAVGAVISALVVALVGAVVGGGVGAHRLGRGVEGVVAV